MLRARSRLGPYEILLPLDIETVEAYRAYDHGHQREVTLQVFRVAFGAVPARLRAFEADVRRAAVLAHPHILEIHDVGTDAHAAYVVSAPCPGDTLRRRLDARAVSVGDALRWAAQIARALAAARRARVRHGHLSVDTVAIDAATGRLVVLGFGLASLAQPDRRSSDLRALAGLTGTMLRAGWHTTPRRWRTAWAAASLVVLAVIVTSLLSSPSDTPAPSAAPVPTAAGSTAALRTPEEPAAAAPVVAIPSTPPPAGAVVAAPPEQAVVSRREEIKIGDSRSAPAAPSAKPAPPAVDAPLVAPVPAAPARPLTPVVADGRDAASLMTEASVRATEFDLAGAFELSRAAASRGDPNAQIGAMYIRGLIDAREAFREGGPPDALVPVREAIASLQAIARGRPSAAEIARLTLQAAAAAAQSERDEMSLYLETALEMESLQRMAGLPGAPLVSAAEVAGDLWLQVHRYDDAHRAYTEAAARAGSTLRILSGLARAARRLDDTAGACVSYRRLLDAWGGRPGLPVEIAEARAYIGGCAP